MNRNKYDECVVCEKTAIEQVQQVRSIVSQEPTLLEITGAVVVVGDLHGNLDDLVRIFERNGYPPDQKYVFLGDYVDRGCNSVEVLLLLFCLKIIHPECIYLLRGNHESDSICSIFGFKDECVAKLGLDAYNAIIDFFMYLPFAAVINGKVMCCHGGISPHLKNVGQIRDMERPMIAAQSVLSNSLVWSDPREIDCGFIESDRGSGNLFGPSKLHEFLDANGLDLLIRSHESCFIGYDWSFGIDGRCLTVFSNSDYCGISNSAAVAVLNENCEVKFEVFKPLNFSEFEPQKRVLIPEWILEKAAGGLIAPPRSFEEEPAFLNVLLEETIVDNLLNDM